MAITRGPKIVRNGLVLALDAADRNSLPLSNLILNPSTASSYSANQNVTISQDGQYVKTVSNQAASTPGAWPIGGIITVESNTTYLFGIKAKRVSTPTPNFYITNGSNTQILYTISTLTSSTSYTWSYITFNSGANTSVKVGFLWSGPQIGSELSVETVILTKFNTWNDLSGNLDNGVLTNSPNFNNDNGGSIVFDGVDDFVQLKFASRILPLKNHALEVWFKSNGLATNMSAGGLLMVHYGLYIRFVSSGQVAYQVIGYSGVPIVNYVTTSSALALNDNKWHNVVCTLFDNVSYGIYVDGVLRVSGIPVQSWDGTSQWAGINTVVGNDLNNNNYFFQGSIAVAKVYNIGLTANQVLQNFNAQKSRFGL